MKKIDMKLLDKKIIWRFNSHIDRSKRLGIEPPTLLDFKEIVYESIKNGFKCEYCGTQLKVVDNRRGYPSVFSIDHKEPLKNIDGLSGTNKKENLAVCCNRCNIVKRTMSAKTYCNVLLYLPPNVKENFLHESFLANLSHKIQTVKNERITKPILTIDILDLLEKKSAIDVYNEYVKNDYDFEIFMKAVELKGGIDWKKL